MSCDQGSNFVRTFAQIGLHEPAGETNQENQENLDQSVGQLTEMNEDQSSDEEEELEVRAKAVTFEHVDNELINMNQAIDIIEFATVIQVSKDSLAVDSNLLITTGLDSNEFESNIDIAELHIVIGSTDIPRFACACHKLNIVVRTAVINQGYLKNILKSLSSFAATNRNNIEINKIFTLAKCRPKLENVTRY